MDPSANIPVTQNIAEQIEHQRQAVNNGLEAGITNYFIRIDR